MPEHVHLILPPDDEASGEVSAFLLSLERPFAIAVLKRWRELDAAILPKLRDRAGDAHFWQTGGGYDRNVFGDELIEKIMYSHANPVTRGLVKTSADWRWSSAPRYEARADAIGPEIDFDRLPPTRRRLT